MIQTLLAVDAQKGANKVSGLGNLDQYFPSETDLGSLFDHPRYEDLLAKIVRSAAFQRLKDIRFLGAIDYLVLPNGSTANRRHTRFDHSLCVAKLAREYSLRKKLNENDERHLVVAALLHDIGHGPLSHSLEPVFKERFRIAHHDSTEHIIKGVVSIGADLPRIFSEFDINVEEVISLISGTSSMPHGEALRNPINLDTIEAISRAYVYMAPGKVPPPPSRIVKALVDLCDNDIAILDGFWHLKHIVYDQLINGRIGVIADYLCREYMRRNAARFSSYNFFTTESALRDEHPQLFAQLKALRATTGEFDGSTGRIVEYSKRNFYIDESIDVVDISSFYQRYRQSKTVKTMRVDLETIHSKLAKIEAGRSRNRKQFL